MTPSTEGAAHVRDGAGSGSTAVVRHPFRRPVRDRDAPPRWWLTARRESHSFIDGETPE